MRFFIAIGTERRGPFEMHELTGEGMRSDTLVWREGMADWLPAMNVPELGPVLAPVPAVSGVQPAFAAPIAYGGYGVAAYNPADVSSKKVLAGVMAILFGGLGIHKFILGMPGPGVAMLLISLLGGCFTFGIASLAMHIIALIEGIMYLTKSDPDFYRIYMVQKRSWF